MTFPCMTTTVTAKGTVVLPQKVLKQHRVRAGDKLEITAAPDEPGVIELRRVGRKPNEGLVELLRSCPCLPAHLSPSPTLSPRCAGGEREKPDGNVKMCARAAGAHLKA